jgi:hypothetical protein
MPICNRTVKSSAFSSSPKPEVQFSSRLGISNLQSLHACGTRKTSIVSQPIFAASCSSRDTWHKTTRFDRFLSAFQALFPQIGIIKLVLPLGAKKLVQETLSVCPLAYRSDLGGKSQFRLGADERANRSRRLQVRLARRRDVGAGQQDEARGKRPRSISP